MRRRRIFKPAHRPRRWGTFAMVLSAMAGAFLLAVALPTELFGSAPRDQSWTASAAELRVVDGETLRMGERTLRLFGLGAPERGQICGEAARPFDCGAAATEALARLVADRGVECQLRGRDRRGRALGICRAAGVELNASLVAAGWALADATALPALGPLEAAAREARRGLWSGGAAGPEAWRRQP